jgi:predicted  nucleic acid-binding Zn-ribbon protein
MTIWDERLREHPLNAGIDRVLHLVQQAEERDDLDPSSREQLHRIRHVSQYLVRTLSQAEPALVSAASLNSCSTHLDSLAAELTQFLSNGNSAHLTNANGQADRLIQQIPAFRLIESPNEIGGVREAVVSFRQSAGQHLRHLNEEADRLEELLGAVATSASEVQSEIKTQKARLDTAIAEFQNQFSRGADQRAEQFQQAEQKRLETANQALEESKVAFAELVDEHEKLLESLHDTKAERLDDLLNSAERSFEVARQDISGQGERLLGNIESLKDEATKIVGVIASTGMAGGYQKIADAEHRSAMIFQITTVISIFGLIVFAVWAFLNVVSGGFLIGLFVAKSFAAISFGVLAGYSARQADRHQSNERYHRRMELELSAIGPYLAALPEETQIEIRRELAQKMFGGDATAEIGNLKDQAGTTVDLLRLALESLNHLTGK